MAADVKVDEMRETYRKMIRDWPRSRVEKRVDEWAKTCELEGAGEWGRIMREELATLVRGEGVIDKRMAAVDKALARAKGQA